MPRYVAFLRAINVGGHTVKMDHLRRIFESLDFSNVETFIASGNVIFDSKTKKVAPLEQKIEVALREALGYEVKTFVRSIDELSKVIPDSGFSRAELGKDGNILYVGFLAQPPSAQAKTKLLSLNDKINDLHINGREVYWLRRTAVGQSEYSGGVFEKALAVPVTFRSSTTVTKIAAKYS
jgi:uncharacterized protein (DUF1697 family)